MPFTMIPGKRDARQTAGRDLSSLLRLKQDALKGALGEVDQYGQRTRGADIMAQIEGMTPEQKKAADFMALGGKGTQNKQTMDILKGLAGEQESQRDRESKLDYLTRSQAGNINLAKYKDKLSKGEPLNATETKGLIDGMKTVDKDLMLRTGQLSKETNPKAKAGIWAKIQDLQRQKTNMARMLDPSLSKGVETEMFKRETPSRFAIEKAFPMKPSQGKKKKETNIFGF